VRAYNKDNLPAESFGPEFTVTITEIGTKKVINNPPTFANFPSNIEFFQGVPYLEQNYVAKAIDTDGLVAKIEVEMLTVFQENWIDYQVSTDTIEFKFKPYIGLPTG
jgi:hypothetical protein